MFSLLSKLSTEQHRRNNQLAHNMIGEHVHTVSFLKNIMDQADMMTENTAIVISQESEGLVEVETNFEAKLVDYQLPTLFSKKMFFISKTGIVVGIQEKPSTRAIIAMMLGKNIFFLDYFRQEFDCFRPKYDPKCLLSSK